MFETFAVIFEIIMVICFGISWPFNIVRAYKARTTKGTSILFMLLIFVGYIAGVLCKVFTIVDKGSLSILGYFAFAFYIINLSMVSIGILIYFRNKRLDLEAKKNEHNWFLQKSFNKIWRK